MDFLHVGHKSKQSSRTMLLSSASMAAELEAIHDVNQITRMPSKMVAKTASIIDGGRP
jgi:hypothetical protein